MEGESRELGDAGVVGRRVGVDGAKRQGLATGVVAGGDAVVDGGAEELLEIVGGFEVEGGGIVIAQQQPLLFRGAGCAGGDGVEQALEVGLGRSGDTVETGRFVIERVAPSRKSMWRCGLRLSAEPKRWMRVTVPVRAPAPERNPARRTRKVETAR